MAMRRSRPGSDQEQVQLLCCQIEHMIEYMAAGLLSGRRGLSPGPVDGSSRWTATQFRRFYRPGITAVIGCLWLRIVDVHPVPDGESVTGF